MIVSALMKIFGEFETLTVYSAYACHMQDMTVVLMDIYICIYI